MDLSDAPELVPVFTGTMDKLPSCIAVTPYLQLTPIKNWSLENFLRRTSLGIDVFLKALGLISSHKKLDEHIFPFIEDALFARETEPEEHKLWIEAINREMNDVDSAVEALDRSKAPTSSSKSAVRAGASVMAYRPAQPFLLMLIRF
ncbi:hypothetical protein BGZ97_004642, partial [Linnemannia gamsii]